MPRDMEFNADNYYPNTTKDWIDLFGADARILCVVRDIGGEQGGPVVIKHVDEHGFLDIHRKRWDTAAPIFIDGNNKPIMLMKLDTIRKYNVLWESVFIFDPSIKRRK